MEVIKARNLQQAFPRVLELMYGRGQRTKDEMVVYDRPCAITLERPDERLLFWPGYRLSPAKALLQAYQSLATAEPGIAQTAQSVLNGSPQFLFSTPVLVVQARITSEGRFETYAILTTEDPMVGVAGQLGLQLSMLHELLANAAKKKLGSLTIQHMRLAAPEERTSQLLLNSLNDGFHDPYERGEVKPRSLDDQLEMGEAIKKTLGLRSKWSKHVFIPLQELDALPATEARAKLGSIKASDWRLAMERYLA